MKAVLHSDTCGCRLIATPGFLTCAGEQPRSALGPTRKSGDAIMTSALPPTADIPESGCDVRKVPKGDVTPATLELSAQGSGAAGTFYVSARSRTTISAAC